ncbi:hypothetical protein Nepgr_030278 [Nepenthes gracilis]|uniref:CASP-like protein n=1 Tax=Nepenthes gracilis TaxID=150966 RepID=A0AAD3TF16_NEPGR|nr:hypothetical protein Nepgr_030278 [Nepenthes gracilis]
MEAQYDGVKLKEVAGGRGRAAAALLRAVALVLTLTSTLVLALDKETKAVAVTIGAITLEIPVTAKIKYSSTFVYSVVVNAIASGYGALSLLLMLANKGGKVRRATLLLVVGDMIMVALLFSGVGAAMAIGVIALKGNSHLRWNKVCNVFSKFCHIGLASFGFSLGASIAYLLLVSIAVFHLQK